MIMHDFTKVIIDQLSEDFEIDGEELLNYSLLLQYINEKTKSVNRGSKSRSNFGNLYAIYVIVEDYIDVVFNHNIDYQNYEGANFSTLFNKQRELPFGEKLQNHHLNHRLNQEFHKFFPTTNEQIIIRDPSTRKYWINANLLLLRFNKKQIDISLSIISIIDKYINAKSYAFNLFIDTCENLKKISSKSTESAYDFIISQLQPDVDARIFEIVSYSILKYYYHDKRIFWGYSRDSIIEETLKLYKTGRTNANDGGIDFVMRPLGYFFQVTETLDVKKYFLDIEKVEHYPIRFVIKTNYDSEKIIKILRADAKKLYGIEKIVDRYMSSIEEIINIPILTSYFKSAVHANYLRMIFDEIILQSKIEFNFQDYLFTDDQVVDDEDFIDDDTI